MRKIALLFITIAICICLVMSSGVVQAEDALAPTTDANFKQDVLDPSLKQPVIVFFMAPWCGPCRKVQPELVEIVRTRKARVVSIDIDQNPITPGQFGVSTLPVTIVFRNGLPTDQVVGVAVAKIREISQALR